MHVLQTSANSETAMNVLGQRLAPHLEVGDTLLLTGPIGAGKTHLARSMILSRLDRVEEVPSPTFTLVQTYEAEAADIWHVDLYRLGDSSELVELGLDDAFADAIVIIEWPDRVPNDMLPCGSLNISIEPLGAKRSVTIASESHRWLRVIEDLEDV